MGIFSKDKAVEAITELQNIDELAKKISEVAGLLDIHISWGVKDRKDFDKRITKLENNLQLVVDLLRINK